MVTITSDEPLRNLFAGKCGCHHCIEERSAVYMHMIVCPQCNNKRCPHASDHKHDCTNSNAPGQQGSIYA